MCLTTWTAHMIEDTTLLEALHVQLVTELYLHIFTYNKLEVSRLDSTLLCSSSFVLHTLSWCQISGKILRILQWSNSHIHSISRGILRGFEYSDFFQDHLPQHIGDTKKRVYFYGLETGLESQTCTTELNIYMVRKNIGNLRHFYFLQDHKYIHIQPT